ncbi:hypothetical protein Bca4012_062425 [Brassica carinata]
MHIDKISAVREGESTMIAMIDYHLYLMRVVLCFNKDPLIERKESRYSYRPWGYDKFNYTLGYKDKGSCRSYKFLRFIDKHYSPLRYQFSWYEIYDFDSSSWKTLDVTPHWRIQFSQRGVSLKGNTYWPASQRNMEEDVLDDQIICFDFTSESFGPLLPLPFYAENNDDVTLSCVIREDKLAVLFTHDEEGPREFEIWITTKIETEKVLWSKFLRVEETDLYPLITCDSFLIDKEKKVAMCVEEDYCKTFNIVGEAGTLKKKLKLVERLGGEIHCKAKVCSYVSSLVKIKQPAPGRKRKQQSDLERQRYDQNMSKLVSLGDA